MKTTKGHYPIVPRLVEKYEFAACAEIGVRRGELSELILFKPCVKSLVLVDPWGGNKSASHYRIFKKRMDAWSDKAKRRVRVLKMTSEEATTHIEDKSLDFVYIDADHHYEHVKQDILLWAPKLREGGMLAGHDYSETKTVGVKRAVDEIVGEVSLENTVWWTFRWEHLVQ